MRKASMGTLWDASDPARFRETGADRADADRRFVSIIRDFGDSGPVLDLPGPRVWGRYEQMREVRRGPHVMVERDDRAFPSMYADVSAINSAAPLDGQIPVILLQGDFFDALEKWHGMPFRTLLYCHTRTLSSLQKHENLERNLSRVAASPKVNQERFWFMITAAKRDEPHARQVILDSIPAIFAEYGWRSVASEHIEYGGGGDTMAMLTHLWGFAKSVALSQRQPASVKKGGKRKQVNIRLEPELHDGLVAYARRNYKSVSAVIREQVFQLLNHNAEKEP